MTASSSANSNGTLRCGVVGVGRMGRHHARVYAEAEGVELVGVVDQDAERGGAVAEKHGTKAFTSEEQLLSAGVDAVSIAVPTVAHLPASSPFLEAGVGCLIEKPLAPDAGTAEKMKAAAEKSGACLMVGHIERFNPVIRAVQNLESKGMKIVPRFVDVQRVSPMTFRSVDVGVVMDMMIHDLDVVLMLMGNIEPDRVEAAGVAVVTEHEDICNARLFFETEHGPCVANLSASRLAMKTERVTRITGESGYIKIDYAQKKGTAIHRTANEAQRREVADQLRQGVDLSDLDWSELVNIEPLDVEDADQLEMEIGAFLDAVRTGEAPPIDAEAGLANVRTAERIVASTRDFLGGFTRPPE
ncbi:MAG: Gfo/Idh/MocA family oxidoreductase [Planctomycetota bacterium]